MSEQRANWFQRLVGADGAAPPALEEQLTRIREEAQLMSVELEREREKVAQRDQAIELLEARFKATEQDFEARLISVRHSLEERLASSEQLEKEHKRVQGELEAARTQQQRLADEKTKLSLSVTRQRDEAGKLTKSLTTANAQVAQGEAALQSARAQASELEAKATELERASEARAKELADAKRKLQAVETRASTVEHELAQTKQAQQAAEAAAGGLATAAKELTQAQEKLTRAQEELRSSGAQLVAAQAQRDLAVTIAKDLWRSLDRAVGEAAPIALVLGVETGNVERSPNLGDATVALKRALESQALCQGIKVEPTEDGLVVEMRALQLPKNDASANWLMASATRFLEKAAGLELALESSTVEQDTLTFRLRTPAGSRPS